MSPPVVPARSRGQSRALRPTSIDIPPPRYRVIEKDRRLVVIDRHTDRPVVHGDRASPVASASTSPGLLAPALTKVSFDGTADLVTQAFYDDHGPRTIRLDPNRAAIVERIKLGGIVAVMAAVLAVIVWPWLLGALALLASKPARTGVKCRITHWLDQAARETA